MVEVMTSPYIRTAKLKGAPLSRIILRHALRNALITPVTVIMLQIPWLLSGVIVVEVFFAYPGFGTLLYQAALNSDIYLIEACAMVGVVVVVATQILSDVFYTLLKPAHLVPRSATRKSGVMTAAAMLHFLRPLRHPLVAIGVALVGGWIAVALFAPWLAPHDPFRSIAPLLPPGAHGPHGETFWLGTDFLGRDILSRLIYGARPVVMLSTFATLTAYAVGIAGGLSAGYFRGPTDTILSAIANVILSFPVLILYIVIIVALGASDGNVVIAVTFGTRSRHLPHRPRDRPSTCRPAISSPRR